MSDDMRSRVVVVDVVAGWLVPKPTTTTSILNVVHILIGMFRINRKSLFYTGGHISSNFSKE